MNEDSFVGRHLILDVKTYSQNISDVSAIYNFLEILSRVVDMTLVYPPIVARFPWASCELEKFVQSLNDEGIKTNTIERMEHLIQRRTNELAGVSGITVWLESHAAIHTWTEDNFFSFDCYSCKDFDVNKALEFIKNYFDIHSWNGLNIVRSIGEPQKIELIN